MPTFNTQTQGLWVLGLVLLIAMWKDMTQRKIPNALLVVASAFALLWSTTAGGVGLASALVGGVVALLVFVVVNIVTGYVSVGSLMAGLSIPVLFLQVFGYRDVSLIVFSVSVGILIVYTHRKNIRRLMAGEETKSRILVRKQK